MASASGGQNVGQGGQEDPSGQPALVGDPSRIPMSPGKEGQAETESSIVVWLPVSAAVPSLLEGKLAAVVVSTASVPSGADHPAPSTTVSSAVAGPEKPAATEAPAPEQQPADLGLGELRVATPPMDTT